MKSLRGNSTFRSIRKKIILPLILFEVVLCAFVIGVIYYKAQMAFGKEIEARGASLARATEQFAEISGGESPELMRAVQNIGTEKDVNLVLVFFGDPLRVIASSKRKYLGMAPDALDMHMVPGQRLSPFAGELKSSFSSVGGDFYVFNSLFRGSSLERPGHLATGVASVLLDASEVKQRLFEETRLLVLIAILGIALHASITYRLLGEFVFRPVNVMVQEMGDKMAGKAVEKIPSLYHDEIGMVADTLNELIQSLEESNRNIRVSEERFRLVGELATDGYWDWDLKTNEEYLSPSFKRLFGYEDHELPNHADSWQKIIHPDDLKLAIKAFEAHTQRGEPFNVTVRYFHKNGDIVWVICRGVALKNEAGEYYRMIGTHTDVTHQKKSQEETQRMADELKRSNQELEQFAFVASHDLQEPLRTITGYVQLIERRFGGQLDKEGQEFLGFIVDGASRMKQLINDLLVYSRSGRMELGSDELDLNVVLKTVRSHLSARIEEESAQITVSDLPTVKVDETQITLLFQNLISNALKFRKPNATARVAIEYRLVVDEDSKQWHEFSIEDNGIGIKQRHFERMFQIFQRLNKRGIYPGTGIGLSICKKIVERYGGRIWVESEFGKGTTFYFTLPKTGR